MKKVKLKLSEVFELNAELTGVINPATGEQLQAGLLEEKLKLSIKYALVTIKDTITPEIERVEALRAELIKTLGEPQENGEVAIPFTLAKKADTEKSEEGTVEDKVESWEFNPKYREYITQMNELLAQEVELDLPEIALKDLDVETKVTPRVLFKLID